MEHDGTDVNKWDGNEQGTNGMIAVDWTTSVGLKNPHVGLNRDFRARPELSPLSVVQKHNNKT